MSQAPLREQLEILFDKHMDITGGYDIYDRAKLIEDIASLQESAQREARIDMLQQCIQDYMNEGSYYYIEANKRLEALVKEPEGSTSTIKEGL